MNKVINQEVVDAMERFEEDKEFLNGVELQPVVEHIAEDQMEISKYNPQTKKQEKVLTPKQKAFLSHLSGDAKGNIREAMAMAGYSQYTKPEEVFGNLTEEIIKVANNLLSANAVKAVVGLVGVLDAPTKPGNKDVIAAAKELLDRVGMFKKDPSQGTTNIRADTIFILPAKDSVDNSKLIE
jgi:hypothetical protein